MSASVGGVEMVVIPGLLFLLALVLLAPGPLRMFGGAVMMLAVMGLLFWRSGAPTQARAMPPARIERAVPVPAAPPAPVPVPVPEPEVVVPE